MKWSSVESCQFLCFPLWQLMSGLTVLWLNIGYYKLYLTLKDFGNMWPWWFFLAGGRGGHLKATNLKEKRLSHNKLSVTKIWHPFKVKIFSFGNKSALFCTGWYLQANKHKSAESENNCVHKILIIKYNFKMHLTYDTSWRLIKKEFKLFNYTKNVLTVTENPPALYHCWTVLMLVYSSTWDTLSSSVAYLTRLYLLRPSSLSVQLVTAQTAKLQTNLVVLWVLKRKNVIAWKQHFMTTSIFVRTWQTFLLLTKLTDIHLYMYNNKDTNF